MCNLQVAQIPPVLSIEQVDELFKITRTNLYLLAAAGEVVSMMMGAPGAHGKRVFLAQSLIDYMNRRIVDSPKINTKPKQKKEAK